MTEPITLTRAVHHIPVGGDEPAHTADGACWCYPTTMPPANKEDAPSLIHNAMDCREAYERQGKKRPGCFWVIVFGITEPLAFNE